MMNDKGNFRAAPGILIHLRHLPTFLPPNLHLLPSLASCEPQSKRTSQAKRWEPWPHTRQYKLHTRLTLLDIFYFVYLVDKLNYGQQKVSFNLNWSS